ncbi:MAG TPA: cytochrome c family protein [Hyphomicrobiaceae bacterium]|nr:cytochrome c family protein [Hyphomicrobiaceae bacterium]
MDGFEFNKIAGAVLTAMLVMAGSRTLLDIALAKHAPEKPGWALPVKESKGGGGAPAPAEPAFDAAAVLALLPKANADGGQAIFKKCMACHSGNKGGPNMVGPNLYGIVGRKVGTAAGFEARYSEAMKTHGGEWTFERLAKYLHKPQSEVPGNKMVFAGIPDSADLADLLVYLRTLSDSPAPLPTPAAK